MHVSSVCRDGASTIISRARDIRRNAVVISAEHGTLHRSSKAPLPCVGGTMMLETAVSFRRFAAEKSDDVFGISRSDRTGARGAADFRCDCR
jgi:hypothetical protein